MKKLFLLLLLPAVFSFVNANTITDNERAFAINNLQQTQAGLIASVKGLSDAQLNFKAAPDRWSILECVQHIVLSSQLIWQGQQAALKQPNDSNWKASVADTMLIKMVEDRSHKVQTAEPMKPVHAPFKTLAETLTAFNADRSKLIDYMRNSQDDMRAHFSKAPFGYMDAYQMILLLSAHTNRHTQQIEEVKADPNYPKQ
jgi:hypothetical protein